MKTLVAFSAVVLFAIAGAASANSVRVQSGERVKDFTVNTADLKSEEGAKTVYSRLRDVVDEVCDVDGDAPAWVLEQDRQCVAEAMAGALAELKSEPLRQVAAAEARSASAYARNDR